MIIINSNNNNKLIKIIKNNNSNLPATHDFVPVAIESLGPVNRTGREFLMELGRRMTTIFCDPRETAHLFQRLSICSKRFHAIAFRGTFPQSSVSLDL